MIELVLTDITPAIALDWDLEVAMMFYACPLFEGANRLQARTHIAVAWLKAHDLGSKSVLFRSGPSM